MQADRISQIKKMLETSPQDSFLQHALALEYIKLNDDAGARALFESVLAHDPAYTGSYYHLGKLLERQGERNAAQAIYEQGMAIAREQKERHAYNELQSAYEDLMY
ncbi:Tetratricopeptide repeat-containing protein [Chitinophaga costaii]|uniref:Tetratricopeptide repeat-containing protein n=1 Tax=Chitinophaga costaii TaxID=1335309 RepID=A0A1C4FIF5_9BACT|nr:tetratricopeptide repeat protein [Chitinophaga costaii]PUZ20275.1 tetratricopeptide repeat protein [Chitinophaga costaii]SCC55261.1 Tetratricopeptide repeat-containing protein [Chitinophaga costaii]